MISRPNLSCSHWLEFVYTRMLSRCHYVHSNEANVNLTMWLPTVYVVQGKVMFRHVSVHRSFCLSTSGGGGYPGQVQAGGIPLWGGTHLGYPPLDLARGVPLLWGTPRSTLGTPLRPGQGYPCWGYLVGPTSGTPLVRTGQGGGVPHLR